MKWINKGFEFEKIAEKLIDLFERKKTCYIFGAGIMGKELFPVLKYFDCFSGFIDNDINKQRDGYCTEKVISFQDFLRKENKETIVIAASDKNTILIRNQLENCNLMHGIDFFEYGEFVNEIFPIVATYYYQKVFVNIAQITLTERCTLKCRKCAHACYAIDASAQDMMLEEVYRSADIFFSKVDYIREFVLIGGEPLLYKEIEKVITYIGEKYRNRMSIFCITTNGTIVPSKEILEVCKKQDVLFRISNYSAQLPRLKKAHYKLVEKLKEWNISYILGEEDLLWRDYGFEYVNHGVNNANLIEVFDKCKTICREIRGNRFYYCVMARSVTENLKYNVGEFDYLDLEALDSELYQKEILEFNLGYSEKGYLDMCQFCHGAEAFNYPIPAAEQI